MSETIIDYDKTNKYLPETLRQFVGTADRIVHQDFAQFMPFYSGVELSAVFNNKMAAEFAGGFTNLNYQYLRSGTAPQLLKTFVRKAVGQVWYQAEEENEVVFNDYLERNYFSNNLKKATKEAAMTGRSIMVVYPKEENVEIATYNLFRHRIVFDSKMNVKEAWIYINRIDNKDSYSNVICEHRYYGKVDKKPYQKFTLYQFDSRAANKATPTEVADEYIPKNILETYPDIEFNVAKKLEYPSIGVYDIPYTLDNSKFIDVEIPESMFVDALDTGVCLDSSITGKEVDKEIGRGRILYPDFEQVSRSAAFADASMVGNRVMVNLTNKNQSPIMTPYPSRSMEDSKPINTQFDLRSDQWIQQISDDTARLCANIGMTVLDYDPRLLQAGQRTDDEINAMTDITANTVKGFREIIEGKVNALLTDVATFFKLNVKVSIRWSMASILNPSKNTDLIIRQLGAGLISRKEAIRRANPDLNEKEVDDLYKEVVAEQGAMATENAFNNF